MNAKSLNSSAPAPRSDTEEERLEAINSPSLLRTEILRTISPRGREVRVRAVGSTLKISVDGVYFPELQLPILVSDVGERISRTSLQNLAIHGCSYISGNGTQTAPWLGFTELDAAVIWAGWEKACTAQADHDREPR